MKRLSAALLFPWIALAACTQDGAPEAPTPAEPARAAAVVEVVDFAGLESALAARKGRGYLLNFWAIWCAPCVAEMPELVETDHAWRERGGEVVTVNYDLMLPDVTPAAVREEVRAFAADRGIDLAVYIYEGLDFDAVDERFDLPGGIPVTLAIDAAGRIVDRENGQADRARFEVMMAAALGK